jgi:deazaflavin-dependent oxidoreductase (nitroreductase family)
MEAAVARTRMSWLRPLVILFNPLSRLVAGWLPGFGILTYRGRKTGRTYHTPINVFRRGDHVVFFLTYGSDVQWVRNVRSARECRIRTGGRDLRLVEPELIVDPERRLVPPLVRLVGGVVGVTEFLRMRVA